MRTWVTGFLVIVASILCAIAMDRIVHFFFDYRWADWAALGLVVLIGLPYYVGKLVNQLSAGYPAKESQ